jgi:hypothetical protein
MSNPYPDTPIPPEEYRLFTHQSEPVLRSYRLARINLASVLPFFVLLSVYHTGIALTFAVIGGIVALFFLRKKYDLKAAAVPLMCALSGSAIGVFLISPLVKTTEIIREAYRGF